MKVLPLLLCLMPLLLACESNGNGPTRVEKDFGVSVRKMVEEQKYTPSERVRTGQQPSQPLDGAEAVKTIDRYNETKDSAAAKSKSAKRFSAP